jgi:hypothetical protein
MVLGTATAAQAAITVTNTNDSGPGSLRQAIAEAPPGETIVVPAGTYTLTSAPLRIEKGVKIAGHATADTVVRAGAPFRVVESLGEFATEIADLTIQDGIDASNISSGGGVYNSSSDLTLRRVAVVGNTASSDGAAIGIAQGGGVFSVGPIHVLDSAISGNRASAAGASGGKGGIAQGGGIFVIGSFEISNSTVAGNVGAARGGAGPPNPAQSGGLVQGAGLFTIQTNTDTGAITGSTVSANLADAIAGPGASGGLVQGGGAFTLSEAPVAFSNSTVALNTARVSSTGTGHGAGIYFGIGEPGFAELRSMTLSGNQIEGQAPLSRGGNLYTNGVVHFRNSIIANGAGPAGSENCFEAEGLSLGFNIDSLDQCGFKGPGDWFNTDPQLGPLQFNGGPTQTMAPALGSPAIDGGSAFGLMSDQRGIVRPIDLPTVPNPAVAGADGSDIGAVELQPSNALSLGKLKRNKKKGTAVLTVNLPAPSVGTLTLAGKGLRPQTKAIAGETEVKLKIAIRNRKIRKALRRRGRRKVGIRVTYTPAGNAAATATRKATLVKKRKKHKRKHRKHVRR